MNPRTVCKICKIEGTRVYCITNTHLQELYENDTGILIPTDDKNPFLACITCCDRLKHCYEERNTITILDSDDEDLEPSMAAISPLIHNNNTCIVQSELKCIIIQPEQLREMQDEFATNAVPDATWHQNDVCLNENNEPAENTHIMDEMENTPNKKAVRRRVSKRKANEDSAKEKAVKISRSKTKQRASSYYKKYTCYLCNKHFRFKNRILNHICMRSSEKPYKCNICSKCFTRKCNLNNHLCIHTDDECK